MAPHRAPLRAFCGLLLGFAILCGLVISTGPAASQEAKGKKGKKGPAPIVPSVPGMPAVPAPPEDTNDLCMEVNALRTLFLLRVTDSTDEDGSDAVGAHTPIARLNALKNNFSGLAKKNAERDSADCSDAYRDLLVKLRAALLVEDEDQAEVLDRKLKVLQEEELPDLDDEIAITDGARQKVADFIGKNVTAHQIVNYLNAYGKGLPNPRGLLISAMRVRSQGNGPKLSGDDWTKTREFTIREVSLQLGGVIEKQNGEYSTKIAELLDQSYKACRKARTQRQGGPEASGGGKAHHRQDLSGEASHQHRRARSGRVPFEPAHGLRGRSASRIPEVGEKAMTACGVLPSRNGPDTTGLLTPARSRRPPLRAP